MSRSLQIQRRVRHKAVIQPAPRLPSQDSLWVGLGDVSEFVTLYLEESDDLRPTCMAAGIAALDEISSKAADRSEEFM